MRYLLVVGLALGVGGCQFARGFQDGGARMAGDIAATELADLVSERLGDDFKEVTDTLHEIPGKLPSGTPLEEQGLLYTLGALAAYVVGSFGKGALRKYSITKK